MAKNYQKKNDLKKFLKKFLKRIYRIGCILMTF